MFFYNSILLRYVWNRMLTLEGGLPRWVRTWQHGWCPIKGHKWSLNRGRYCKHWTHEKICLVPISLRPAVFCWKSSCQVDFLGRKNTTYEDSMKWSDLTSLFSRNLDDPWGWWCWCFGLGTQSGRAWDRDLCCSLVTPDFEIKNGTNQDSESLKHMEFACISWIFCMNLIIWYGVLNEIERSRNNIGLTYGNISTIKK